MKQIKIPATIQFIVAMLIIFYLVGLLQDPYCK